MLVVPTHHYRTGGQPLSLSDFPTGFAYIAAALKQAGHEVIGVNPNNIKGYPSVKVMFQTVLSQQIDQHKPDLIATGGLATDYAFLNDCITFCRAKSKAPIVLGGQIVSNDAEDVYKLLKPDYAVKGEGELAIVNIANGDCQPGIVQGEYVKDLDTLPFPDYEPFGVRDMLDNYSMDTRLLYRYSRPYPRPFVLVASRSCPFSCSFCIHGHREIPYRARSIPNIIEEIRVNYEKYKFNILMIDDELFAVNKQRLIDFSNAVLLGKEKYGWDFDWMFQTHASAKLDLDTLKLARKAGCYLFSYGLESASPAILKSMNKKIEVPQVVEAIKLAHAARIGFSANLIFGDIAETIHTWAESLAFWMLYGRMDFVFLTNLFPYPGSKLFNDVAALFPDKQAYYEKIDQGVVNMTQIDATTFHNALKVVSDLERNWVFVATAGKCRSEVELVQGDTAIYRLWGTCPYCGVETFHRQPMPVALQGKFTLGTGCTNCNRKIKIVSSP